MISSEIDQCMRWIWMGQWVCSGGGERRTQVEEPSDDGGTADSTLNLVGPILFGPFMCMYATIYLCKTMLALVHQIWSIRRFSDPIMGLLLWHQIVPEILLASYSRSEYVNHMTFYSTVCSLITSEMVNHEKCYSNQGKELIHVKI